MVLTVLFVCSNAYGVLVWTEDAAGPNDLGYKHVWYADVGPGGMGDTTAFGAGSWEITGVMQDPTDDGDAFNWRIPAGATFDLHYTGPAAKFVWLDENLAGAGPAVNFWEYPPADQLGVTGNTVYSFAFYAEGSSSWDWQIIVTLPPIPEPAGLGLIGVALLGLRRRRS